MIQLYLQKALAGAFEVHSGAEIGRRDVESGVIHWLCQVKNFEVGTVKALDIHLARFPQKSLSINHQKKNNTSWITFIIFI